MQDGLSDDFYATDKTVFLLYEFQLAHWMKTSFQQEHSRIKV